MDRRHARRGLAPIEQSIFDLPSSDDEQSMKQQQQQPQVQSAQRQLTLEEEAKYAAMIAFCSKYTKFAAQDRARKALLRLTAKSAFCSLLRSMPEAATPDSLPILWSKLVKVFRGARTLCKMIVAEIKRATDLRLQEDKLELKSMSSELKAAGDNAGLRRMIHGKKKLIRGETRKVELLYELLDGRKMISLKLPRWRKVVL